MPAPYLLPNVVGEFTVLLPWLSIEPQSLIFINNAIVRARRRYRNERQDIYTHTPPPQHISSLEQVVSTASLQQRILDRPILTPLDRPSAFNPFYLHSKWDAVHLTLLGSKSQAHHRHRLQPDENVQQTKAVPEDLKWYSIRLQ